MNEVAFLGTAAPSIPQDHCVSIPNVSLPVIAIQAELEKWTVMPDERLQLLAKVKGQRIKIPDLMPVYAGWGEHVNPHWKRLVEIVDAKLDTLLSDQQKLAKLKKADFALFGSMSWPYADFHQLKIVTFLAIWLFLWDDEIDEATGSLNNSFEAAQVFRQETISFIEHTLDIGAQGIAPSPRNPIINSFRPVSEALCEAYDIEQRKMFFNETRFYIEMSEREQKTRLSGKVPTLQEYWETRRGSGAVGMCVALMEFATKTRLPTFVKSDPAFIELWDDMNIIICASNDMLSLKKEIALESIESFIPLACANNKCHPQLAVDTATEMLRTAVSGFDAAAKTLSSKCSDDAVLQRDLETFIEGCRQQCMGNHTWSLCSSRYGVNRLIQEDGSIEFLL